MEYWNYDWEVYHNFACVTFIHSTTPIEYINAYVKADIQYLNNEELIKNISDDKLLSDEYKYLLEKRNEYKNLKKKIISLFTCKSFFFYFDTKDSSYNICQLKEFVTFFTNHKILMGYNSFNYDSKITDFILANYKQYDNNGYNVKGTHICTSIKTVSDEVVYIANNSMNYNYKFQWLPKYYKRIFDDYDIQKILYLDKSFTGLKSVSINLKWHRLQELPIHFTATINLDDIFTIYDYNVNDVLITYTLAQNQKEELKLREEISKEYDINVLNESRSSIGKRLMSKYYSEAANIPYSAFKDLRTNRGIMSLSKIIDDRIHFITEECSNFLKDLKKQNVTPNSKFEWNFRFRGTTYKIAKGGIHSIDDSKFYNAEDGFIYMDADVTSYYPSILEIFKISPKHLIQEIFLKLVSTFKNDRVHAKHSGLKTKAEALKIVINRIYGALSDIMDYLFDPKATYKTTFNGELSLLMLIEKLEVESEGKIHCISANTDGIVCRFLPEYLDLYKKLCNDWSKETQFELEFTEYERYIRSNVNNYIAIKKGFYKALKDNKDTKLKDLEDKYIKTKGLYTRETPFNKGFIHPIVSIALFKYFVYDINYEYTIRNHYKEDKFNIYDYCISQKVDKKFNVQSFEIVDGNLQLKSLQQYNRFYVSNKGICLKKSYETQEISLRKGEYLTIFNNYTYKDDYDIKFKFYIYCIEKVLYFNNPKSKRKQHLNEGIIARKNSLFEDEDFI